MISGVLVFFGLLFPVMSLLTWLSSVYAWKKHQKHRSPVFVPFIGPLLLTAWIIRSGQSLGYIPVAWLIDVGTIAFVMMSPRLISQWWETCSLTKTLELAGIKENMSAGLSFHSTGRYCLRKKWDRTAGEVGMMSLGEIGSFTKQGNGFQLTADGGWARSLVMVEDDKFQVQEDVSVAKNQSEYSIAGWSLKKRSSSTS